MIFHVLRYFSLNRAHLLAASLLAHLLNPLSRPAVQLILRAFGLVRLLFGLAG